MQKTKHIAVALHRSPQSCQWFTAEATRLHITSTLGPRNIKCVDIVLDDIHYIIGWPIVFFGVKPQWQDKTAGDGKERTEMKNIKTDKELEQDSVSWYLVFTSFCFFKCHGCNGAFTPNVIETLNSLVATLRDSQKKWHAGKNYICLISQPGSIGSSQ